MSHQIPWYVARAAGLIAWTLLTASVLWGLSISTRVFRGKPRPAWLLDLHRYLGGLATIFTVLHVGAIIADSYVHFDLMSVLIPFASSWRPVAVAWGVVGLYLLLAVQLTSLMRTHLPKKLWRATHFASFPLFGFATLHALTAGTDGSAWLVQGAAAVAVIAVVGMTLYRITRSRPYPRKSEPVSSARRSGGKFPQQRVVDSYDANRLAREAAQRGRHDDLVSVER
jgi:sulfoxide reductase heme-binding subunit YedZ